MSLIHRSLSDVLHNCYDPAAVTTRGQEYKKESRHHVGSLFCSGRHRYKSCLCDYSVCYFWVLIVGFVSWRNTGDRDILILFVALLVILWNRFRIILCDIPERVLTTQLQRLRCEEIRKWRNLALARFVVGFVVFVESFAATMSSSSSSSSSSTRGNKLWPQRKNLIENLWRGRSRRPRRRRRRSAPIADVPAARRRTWSAWTARRRRPSCGSGSLGPTRPSNPFLFKEGKKNEPEQGHSARQNQKEFVSTWKKTNRIKTYWKLKTSSKSKTVKIITIKKWNIKLNW